MFRVFEGYSKKYFNVSDINIHFVNEFMLFGKMEQYSPSTLRRTINFIKTILNFIERRGIRTAVYEIALPKEIKDENSVTLSIEELNKIKNTVVDNYVQTAKQWLLISCYTVQRISDFMNFSQSQITSIEGNKCLTFQQKTGKKITLPLHKEVLDILKAIDGFPKKMNFQEYNKKIKNIVKQAGICEKILISKRKGFRKTTAQFFKYETVSSHIGRRSFATNFYGKIPTPLLMEATGHSSEKMFLKYIHIADKQKILLLNQYFNELVV
ncbi:tyrosine-type recombinase/integrase [Flavobacterium dauae]|uniref:tyrosine-type recombinase/integrase n=1 Tax=Flavobacterium dauae TaxID=1563479 RepID=UPI00101B3AD2|nr:tyrosine-type recombinase/integrase [Flavobacterium dauae]WLD23604.1 tyrosine-type recombinase/integrase [Flavobacterium dauae]